MLFSLSHSFFTSPVEKQTSSSSSYNLFLRGFILTPCLHWKVFIETATFCLSSLPILPLLPWVHACTRFVIFLMFMCREWRNEKSNKTHCSLFQCTATGKHFTVHPLPCNFYCLAADKGASIDTQDSTIEFLMKLFLLGFVNRFDNSFREIASDVSRLDLAVKHAES